MRLRSVLAPAVLASVAVFACSSEDGGPAVEAQPTCPELPQTFRFPGGTEGHADPLGAKAASQARAGRITREDQIVQDPGARHKVRLGDFVLANDKIAAYIEAEGVSDGMFPFGGEILAIEPVDESGRPRGLSLYGETLFAFGIQTIAPETVTVINDGSDGKAAIVRATGVLKTVPFMETFRILSPNDEDLPAALDYVLEPGSERVVVRLSMANIKVDPVDFSIRQFLGFFHSNRSGAYLPDQGFASPSGPTPFAAWDSGETGFAMRSLLSPLRTEIGVSGFQLFSMKGLTLEACSSKTVDYVEVVTGAPGLDGALEARRRAGGEAPFRAVSGRVLDGAGSPVAGAVVHVTAPDGRYVTRATSGADGAYVVHVGPGAANLTPTVKGFAVPAPTVVASDSGSADLTLAPHGTLEVNATDTTTGEALPVRVQVIPTSPVAPAPEAFGVRDQPNGRLWQEFAVTGKATLAVPPGDHRVVVSRGFAYEIYDAQVTATAGAVTAIDAKLQRSVPPNGSLCADFHVHSHYSNDSADPVDAKVKAAIADGLDVPVSSEHEYVIDFEPVIQRLGLAKWAFGMPSQELTTFTFGHFGVVPILPKPDAVNRGAATWVGKKPDAIFRDVAALPESPAIIVNHPSGGGFQAYFSQAQLDRATGEGTPDLWSDAFAAVEVFNDGDFDENRKESVADWFALLNAGKTYWAVGNSDSHDQRRSHVGYPRTCLRFGTDNPRDLTVERVRDALKAGAAVVSGGLTMRVEGPGGVLAGGSGAAGDYKVEVRAPGWIAAKDLEVIVDGETVQTLALTPSAGPGPGRVYEATVNVSAQSSRPRHYVVFHARGVGDLSPVHPGKRPFAVSNPIYF